MDGWTDRGMVVDGWINRWVNKYKDAEGFLELQTTVSLFIYG